MPGLMKLYTSTATVAPRRTAVGWNVTSCEEL